MRVEDVYENKFHKEPYIMFHLYAQYFHPDTLLERVRDVRFYRQPRTLFKGFTVPDWATAQKQHGWDTDVYSRKAWANAMHDMKSEWTPAPHMGQRQEPNVLQWFRNEQWGQGNSTRLFYNEVPALNSWRNWWRQGGHYTVNPDDERELNRRLHSFTHADQDRPLDLGIDTTTPEGREQFQAEWDALCEMAPELLRKEDLVFPHEVEERSNEPHFLRVWQHYRNFTLSQALNQQIEEGKVTRDDAAAFRRFVGGQQTP